MEISSDDEVSSTPPNLTDAANSVISNLSPEKSRRKYENAYQQFKEWCEANEARKISENVLLAYFAENSKKLKSSTVWAIYSMLKAKLNVKENVDFEKFTKLVPYLKKLSVGNHPKKSKGLTREEVDQFIRKSDDETYLLVKIYNFQSNHKESYLSNYMKKYEYAKQQCMKQYAINNKLMQEKKKLQSIVRNSYDLDGPISSTPISKHSFQNTSLSTITPERNKFGKIYGKGQPTLFTPMKTVPGFAQRLYASKLIDQTTSTVSQGISPAQVVPITGITNTSVPIHRVPLGPMSSLHELQRSKRLK
ncbi:uncharacterized protein LOC123679936 isoform X1 [Harmonia axyridis]|uniref:uncharacterized protein LOC123679936 isoform X1 n=1 Tax=Harmonia axyridis TaxID=115357 RepID=UPI001E279B81|nr:uncharacterized protein LOC123679936 isoform X1 [Harmonia axyridis]